MLGDVIVHLLQHCSCRVWYTRYFGNGFDELLAEKEREKSYKHRNDLEMYDREQ